MKPLLFVVAALLLLLIGLLQQHPAVATSHTAPRRPVGKSAVTHPLIVVRKSAQAPAQPKIVRALPPAKSLSH